MLCAQSWNRQAPALLVHKGIKWKHNPPGGQHHDRSWDKLVRSCKHVFYAIIGTRKLPNEVLSTTFCLVEQSINIRPIPPVDPDSTELEAVKPNHFLLGEHYVSFPLLTLKVSTTESAM